MDLPILTTDTAPEASRPLLDGIAADLGFVPNFAATIAASPTLLAGFDGLRRAVGDGSFDPVRREVVGLAVGVAVDNAYGAAFHSLVLSTLGIDEGEITAMRQGREPADATLGAVYAFARAIVLDRGAVDDAVVRRATEAGLTPVDLLQLVTEATFASLVGLVDNLAGRVELDGPLERWAWK
jgi:alkylhydroperoxidase family enzyme